MGRINLQIKRFWQRYQGWLQTALVLTILVFVVMTFQRHWAEVSSIRLSSQALIELTIATAVMLVSYIWTGQVWGLILKALGYPVSSGWAIRTFLLTNMIKYLPSNLLHLYGRTLAAKKIGISTEAASLSVILDAMLVIASAWILGLFSLPQQGFFFTGLSLIVIFTLIHPQILHFCLEQIKIPFKSNSSSSKASSAALQKYPLDLLLGELGYVFLRGVGFLLIVYALTNLPFSQIPQLISVYSIAWLLGYITPGAPGGIGVYEATLIELLEIVTNLQEAHILAAVALSRLITTIAEIIGAAIAWLDEKRHQISGSTK
jgi:hypothetical protein